MLNEKIINKEFFENIKLCKNNDVIELVNVPSSPTNLYKCYIIKVNGEKSYFFKKLYNHDDTIYFDYELSAATYFARLKIAPKVIYFNKEYRILITEYINDNKLDIKEKIHILAEKIKFFHNNCLHNKQEIYQIRKKKWIENYWRLPLKIQEDFLGLYLENTNKNSLCP